MRTLALVNLILLLSLSQSLSFAGDSKSAVVSIYSTLNSGGVSQGTGFFTSRDGLIYTAYHVIKDARKLRVFNADREFDDNVSVIGIYPNADLAVLQSSSLKAKNYLTPLKGFAQFSPREQISVIGHPHGILFQEIEGRVTSTTAIESKTLWHKDKQIFQANIKIYPIDITSDRGISGAPVLDANENVVGILSGSYGKGRTISWAIPLAYITEQNNYLENPMRPVNISWPRVQLMRNTWTSLASTFVEDRQALQSLYTYNGAIKSLQNVYREINNQSSVSFFTADTYMEYLVEGYSASELLSERDLKSFFDASDEMINDLKPFQHTILDYTKAASNLESARKEIGAIISKRISSITDEDILVEIRKKLTNVISTDERSDTIFRQIVSELSSGLTEVASGINHKRHLSTIDRQDAAAVDKEVKEILKIIHNGVFTVRGSLQAAHSGNFITESEIFIEKLEQIKSVSDLILYESRGQ